MSLISTPCIIISIIVLAINGYSLESQGQLIKALRKTPPRQRHTSRIPTYTQSQLKYGLSTVPYYPSWVDRPLFIDPSLRGPDYKRQRHVLLMEPDLLKRLNIMRKYGLDGPGVFYFNNEREIKKIISAVERTSGATFIPILTRRDEVKHLNALSMIAASPAAFKIKGKNVVIAFGCDISESVRQAQKDRFLFIRGLLPHHTIIKKYYAQTLDTATLEKLRDSLRAHLRKWDGFYWTSPGSFLDHGYRRLAVEFSRDVLMPLSRLVLNEPEFNNKIWGGRITIGHENAYGYGYYEASDGTSSLTGLLECAINNNVDFIIQNEWDEQNENTSLRPTIYNSRAYMRIWRHYAARIKGETASPLSGDDAQIPGLIISMRKVLTLGERLQIQLLHVPTTDWKHPYTVRLKLRTDGGKVVYESPCYTFKPLELHRQVIFLPSETFAAYRVLIPELTVECDGKSRLFSSGLLGVELRPVMNNDFKFVHQVLRDIIYDVNAEFKCINSNKSGTSNVHLGVSTAQPPRVSSGCTSSDPGNLTGMGQCHVKVTAPQELAYAEFLEANQCIYSAGASEPPGRETSTQWAIRVQAYGVKNGKIPFPGKIKVENAKATSVVNYPLWGRTVAPMIDNELPLSIFNAFAPYQVILIDKKGAENASLLIDFPGIVKKRLALSDLLAKYSYVIGGKDGFSLGLQRQLRQLVHPEQLRVREAAFDVDFIKTRPDAPLVLQLVACDGKLWRSRPQFLTMPESGLKRQLQVYSETTGKVVNIEVAAERVPDLKFKSTDVYGTIVPTGLFRTSWGIRGGFTEEFQWHGGMDGSYGNAFCNYYAWLGGHKKWPKRIDDFRPELIKDGWRFNGAGSHIQLTQECVPRRANYTLSFDVKPEAVAKEQVLFDATPYFWGGSVLWRVAIRNGLLMLTVNNVRVNSQLQLPAGQWSQVSITHDWNGCVKFLVNGTVKIIPYSSEPLVQTAPAVIGGRWPDRWFKGELRKITICYGKVLNACTKRSKLERYESVGLKKR